MAHREAFAPFDREAGEALPRQAFRGGPMARAESVNRTHRVVRERAKHIAARRSRIRGLWLPLLLFSSLLVLLCAAVWALLDEYELAVAGSQVASYQVLVPLFWSIPVSAALLAIVWFRQSRGADWNGLGAGESAGRGLE